MTGLQLLWFVLIGVLFAGFFFFEGFDFGVGMSVTTLAKTESEKSQAIMTIGPVWDGNEVWLLTAGGAMFASFPYWYASLFSGYYLILLIILFGLIIRGISFEFRAHSETDKGRKFFDWTLSIGSFIVPFFFGILFISLIQGMPMDTNGNINATFGDYINIFSFVGGIALTLLCYLHGLNFLSLKTLGPIRDRAANWSKKLYFVLYAGLVLFAVLLFLKTDFITKKPVLTLCLLAVIVLLSIVAHLAVLKQKELLAFIVSGVSLMALVALLFVGLFPRVMISSIDSAYDLLIINASSTPYTLKVMTIVTLTILPIVLIYTGWSYYIFRKRVTSPAVSGVN